MAATVAGSALAPRYAVSVDRESARELLASRLEAGAAAAQAERSPAPGAGDHADDHVDYPASGRPRRKTAGRSGTAGGTGGTRDTVQDILTSPVARDLARTAAREIVRGVFGIGRRRR
jgi:hypothetical protein